MTDKEIEEWRQRTRNMDHDCLTVEENLKKGLNIEKVELPNTSGWLISREGNPEDKVLYHIHGGGFINGCTKMAFFFLAHVVNKWGYNVFSVDYRLAPDHQCIDTITDCEDGYKYLLANTYIRLHSLLLYRYTDDQAPGGNRLKRHYIPIY